MLFKTISKDNFRVFVNGVIKENKTIAPKATDKDSQGNAVYQFRRVYSFDEIALNYTKTYASVKNFFLPFKENLSTFQFDKKEWEQKIEYSLHPRVVVGVRACDQPFQGSTLDMF